MFKKVFNATLSGSGRSRPSRSDKPANTRLPQSVVQKIKSPQEALASIKSGDHIFVGTGCATPRTLIAALESLDRKLDNIQLIHFLTDGAVQPKEGRPQTRFEHKVFFVGSDCRDMVKQGKAHYVPISIAHLPRLIENRSIPVDVAFVQVSYPDEHGYVSLGISVDITLAAVLNARTVIAELNPHMPYTHGDSQIPVERIDHFVEVDSPIIEYTHERADDVAEQIGRYVARVIDDNATLQIGLGQIPNEMLKFLTNRRNLGIHTDVITDPIIELIEKGVITGRSKTIHKGKIVTSFCIGTERLYRFVDHNPMFAFHSIDYICDPAIIARNHKMVSVSQAFAVDLMGQVCTDQFKGELYSGVSTQPDFHRMAAGSRGGKSIICMRSTTDDGRESRIRPQLLEGEAVTIPRSDVHYVITECGIAYLFGKSIQERALALIEIAHPDFREKLLQEAKRLGYVREHQKLKSKIAYPEHAEKDLTLKEGWRICVRPAKASDVDGIRDLFYHLSPEDVFTRFFSRLPSMPDAHAQRLCNVDYDDEMAFVAVAGDRENETVVGSACYVVDHATNMGDVAYMVRTDWHGYGVGSVLQECLTAYAKSKNLLGFKADILQQNRKMMALIQKNGPVELKRDNDIIEVSQLFVSEPKRIQTTQFPSP